jgi:hypothetical protein
MSGKKHKRKKGKSTSKSIENIKSPSQQERREPSQPAPVVRQEIKQPVVITTASFLNKVAKMGWKTFVVLAVILGAFVSLYSLRPRFSVTPLTYFDPSNPFNTLFDVKNDGFLSVQNVQPLCAMQTVTLKSGLTFKGAPNFSTRVFDSKHFSKELAPGESNTIVCVFNPPYLRLPSFIKFAEIAIVVDYSAFGFHWPTKVFPFRAEADINGQPRWEKHPAKK